MSASSMTFCSQPVVIIALLFADLAILTIYHQELDCV